jgi:uncharacterized membrane protein
MKLNSELRKEARRALDGQWGKSVLVTLIYIIVADAVGAGNAWTAGMHVIGSSVSTLWAIFFANIVAWGYNVFFLGIRRTEHTTIGQLFDGFEDYSRVLTTTLLQGLFTLLWTLLLIIPGIVKYYSYAMTAYILKDDAEMKNNAAIERSMAMMEGNKFKLFLLDLSLIGWLLLSLLTFGIGLLWLLPYRSTAYAAFYEDLKTQQA